MIFRILFVRYGILRAFDTVKYSLPVLTDRIRVPYLCKTPLLTDLAECFLKEN